MRSKIYSPRSRKRKVHIRSGTFQKHNAIVSFGCFQFRAEIGQNGIAAIKREGDRKTPAGRFKLLKSYYRADRRRFIPIKGLIATALTADMGWCDDQREAKYNQFVRLPANFSHENLFRSDNLYDFIGIFDANIKPQIKDHGSAIFLHVMRQNQTQSDHGVTKGTAGCLALKYSHLKRLLPYISSKTQFIFHTRY